MKITLVLSLLLVFIGESIYAQAPEEIISKYEKSHNAHDIEASLAFLVNDITFDLVGVWTKIGINQMRSLAEWDAALNSNLDFHIEEIRGDSVFCTGLERNDWFKAVGIDPLIHDRIIFVINNGLIHHIIAFSSPEVGQKVGQILQSIQEWSLKNEDRSLGELISEGQFIYSKEAAEKWMNLLQRWKG